MAMYTIENDHLKIDINSLGAELTTIFSKIQQRNLLWNADPAYWARHSPVLFPIVGTLKNDSYHYQDKAYSLARHGFARDMTFKVSAQTDTSIVFGLENTAATLSVFPFEFKLEIHYTLQLNKLEVRYTVLNTGKQEMYFSIGGHPAFTVPFDDNSSIEDYYIEFSEKETLGRWPISSQGLIEALPLPLLNDIRLLPLSRELFKKDALVFKYLQSHALMLKSNHSSHELRFDFTGFPFLGIWSAKDAHFICIEPWCGIADSVDSSQQLIQKEGINLLTPGQLFDRKWSVEIV